MRTTTIAALLVALLLAPAAIAAVSLEQTREGYVGEAELVCAKNARASDRYLRGVRGLVKNDKLKQASARFGKAASALQGAQKQLAAIPQPPSDAAKLDKWLAGIGDQIALMRTIATKLKQGDKGKASSLVVKLTHSATKTNNLVIVFQFDSCKIDPTKYT